MMCNLTGNVRSWHRAQESFLPMRWYKSQRWESASRKALTSEEELLNITLHSTLQIAL